MKRLLFLLLSTSYCFAIEIPGGEIASYTTQENTKVFRLTVSPVIQEIYNINNSELNPILQAFNQSLGTLENLSYKSQVVRGYGYNGHIPGPAIVVTEGDFVKVVVENKLLVPTSLHFMGLRLPYNKEPPIQPGKVKTYEFQVKQSPGTYFYESSYQVPIQLGMGLSGLFIVLPKEADTAAHDFGFILQEWDLSDDGDIRPLSTNSGWFTMNGHSAPNVPLLKVTEGDLVRLRFANTAAASDSPMVLHGFAFRITGTEGGPTEPVSSSNLVAVVVVAPGTTRTVEFVATQPGLWRLSCSIPQKTINGLNQYAEEQNVASVSVGGLFTFIEVAPKPKK